MIPWQRYTASRAAHALKALLADNQTAARARDTAPKIVAEDGAARAAAEIVHLLG
jgi:hypothetical protein